MTIAVDQLTPEPAEPNDFASGHRFAAVGVDIGEGADRFCEQLPQRTICTFERRKTAFANTGQRSARDCREKSEFVVRVGDHVTGS